MHVAADQCASVFTPSFSSHLALMSTHGTLRHALLPATRCVHVSGPVPPSLFLLGARLHYPLSFLTRDQGTLSPLSLPCLTEGPGHIIPSLVLLEVQGTLSPLSRLTLGPGYTIPSLSSYKGPKVHYPLSLVLLGAQGILSPLARLTRLQGSSYHLAAPHQTLMAAITVSMIYPTVVVPCSFPQV